MSPKADLETKSCVVYMKRDLRVREGGKQRKWIKSNKKLTVTSLLQAIKDSPAGEALRSKVKHKSEFPSKRW